MSTERKLDLSKPVMTKKKHEAVVHTTDGRDSDYPVVGEVKGEHGWWTCTWSMEGKWSERHDGNDLVNVPMKHTVFVSFCITVDGQFHAYVSDTKDLADRRFAQYKQDLIACVEITFAEGEGLK